MTRNTKTLNIPLSSKDIIFLGIFNETKSKLIRLLPIRRTTFLDEIFEVFALIVIGLISLDVREPDEKQLKEDGMKENLTTFISI